MTIVRPTRVLLGSNQFVRCESLIAINDAPVLSFDVEDGRPLVTLVLAAPPASEYIQIHQNLVEYGDAIVRIDKNSVQVHLRQNQMLSAVVNADTLTVTQLDLRPVGIALRADTNELRLGGAKVANTVFTGNKIAIFLGKKRGPA